VIPDIDNLRDWLRERGWVKLTPHSPASVCPESRWRSPGGAVLSEGEALAWAAHMVARTATE
jgi:hypothetical protein